VKCPLTRPDLRCETLLFILWNFCGDVSSTDTTGPLLRNFAIHFVKLLRWNIHWQDRTCAAKLCNSFCETVAVKRPLTRPNLCCETLQLILWNFCGEASTDKTRPLLRNFAIHFVKLLRWNIHWQDWTFAAKLCYSFCETFAVKRPLKRPDLCCETFQFILWNFCGEASTDKTEPLLRNFAIHFVKFCGETSTDKTGPLLRNFAIHFVKLLRWSIHWQDRTFAANFPIHFVKILGKTSTKKTGPLLRNFAIHFVKLLWWSIHWQERTFAAKLCNSFCENFAVKHPLTRPVLCCQTLQFILWNFCGGSSTDTTGPLLRNFAIHFVKRLRWSVHWQDQTFAVKRCNSFCETFAVMCPPLTRPDLCCKTLQFILWNFCGETSTDKTGPLLPNFAIHFVKLLRWASTDKTGPLLRNFAINFVKLLRWSVLWQDRWRRRYSPACTLFSPRLDVICAL